MEKKILVDGIKCENCARHVREALSNLKGITSIEVNLDEKYVRVKSNIELSDEEIKNTINSEKYKVIKIEIL